MNIRSVIVITSCAAISFMAFSNLRFAVGGEQKLKVVIFTGGHDFNRKEFFEMFDSFGNVEWEESQQPKANQLWCKQDELKRYDVVVLYDMWQQITDEQKEFMVRALKDGVVGLVVIHHAIASYQNWDEYWRIIGARYFLSPGVDPDGKKRERCQVAFGVKMNIKIADKEHPITRGMSDFEVIDETYKGYWVSPRVKILLTTDCPQNEPSIAWTNEYGKARVVYIQLGHGPEAYRHASYRQLLKRSLLWAAKKLE
ncbi:MAG: ThuA domain-containing protein [Armatimonadota bacterium]|nr:ThuA domain-containing protein [Armatimonadota bacterium]MCX7777836.1 ThuA domain-containing protein [Armatimonadota bacterium]MDW8025827.1 ThuA domain-containing protein [Armatimonadota bacterium]